MAVKVYPERRMRDEHPWNVWKALQRLRVMDKLAGVEDRYYSPSDICNILYSNWPSLDVRQSIWVIEAKINFTIRFLRTEHYIEELVERPSSRCPEFSPMRHMDSWRICYNMSRETKDALGDDVDVIQRQVMDDRWGVWIGRPVIDVDKILEKYA